MTQYRKPPVVIEAFRWTGDANQTDDPEWIVKAIKMAKVSFDNFAGETMLAIMTHDGKIYARQGDYIIRDNDGVLSVSKPDIFEATYEAMDTPTQPQGAPHEIVDTIEAALHYLRRSDDIEMHGDQLERIDTALAWLRDKAHAQGPQADVPQVPRADWTSADKWAKYHTIDANGCTCWHELKPRPYYHFWTSEGKARRYDMPIVNLPIGVDWRTTLVQRPTAGEEATGG